MLEYMTICSEDPEYREHEEPIDLQDRSGCKCGWSDNR